MKGRGVRAYWGEGEVRGERVYEEVSRLRLRCSAPVSGRVHGEGRTGDVVGMYGEEWMAAASVREEVPEGRASGGREGGRG